MQGLKSYDYLVYRRERVPVEPPHQGPNYWSRNQPCPLSGCGPRPARPLPCACLWTGYARVFPGVLWAHCYLLGVVPVTSPHSVTPGGPITAVSGPGQHGNVLGRDTRPCVCPRGCPSPLARISGKGSCDPAGMTAIGTFRLFHFRQIWAQCEHGFYLFLFVFLKILFWGHPGGLIG